MKRGACVFITRPFVNANDNMYLCRANTHCVRLIRTGMKKSQKQPKSEVTRQARLVCLVSNDEMRIIDSYLRKYKISNKSRWMRETLLAFIHQNLGQDYPTLFNEHDMRR